MTSGILPRRNFTPAEVRAARQGRRLEGYAATFRNQADIGGMAEVIAPGAFADTLASGADVLALVDHDPARLLGRTRSGTLRLVEDTRGLAFEIDVPDTALGRDVLALAERGDLGGMSFAFRPLAEGRNAQGVRVLERVQLIEVSVIHAHPAYDATSVQARSRADQTAARRRQLLTLGGQHGAF